MPYPVMGDATGANAAAIPANVQVIAPYVTGLGAVPWPAAALALFPGKPQATIDQGAGNSPRYDACVIDIETGAYTVDHVTGWMNNATAARPTVYVNRGNEWDACIAALKSPRFRGDVWLSFPGWLPGGPLPELPPGCRFVAIQNVITNDYDLSAILDPSWPPEASMVTIPGINGVWLVTPTMLWDINGNCFCIGLGLDGAVWMAKRLAGQPWGEPAPQ